MKKTIIKISILVAAAFLAASPLLAQANNGVTPGGGSGKDVPNTVPGMPGNPAGSATNAVPPPNIAPTIPPAPQH